LADEDAGFEANLGSGLLDCYVAVAIRLV